jgi:hypothetical protein
MFINHEIFFIMGVSVKNAGNIFILKISEREGICGKVVC